MDDSAGREDLSAGTSGRRTRTPGESASLRSTWRGSTSPSARGSWRPAPRAWRPGRPAQRVPRRGRRGGASRRSSAPGPFMSSLGSRAAKVRAMVLQSVGEPLRAAEVPGPEVGPEEVSIRVRACAVCRTDLHVVDGELTSEAAPDPRPPDRRDGRGGRRPRRAVRARGPGGRTPGSGTWTARAATAVPGGRTSATTPASPATR